MDNPLAPELKEWLEASRKSFTAEQEQQFLEAAMRFSDETRLLCELLYLTGCRLSEALALRRSCLDTDQSLVFFHTLKQRKSKLADRSRIRAVPIPRRLTLELVSLTTSNNGKLFPFSRWTGLRRVKEVLAEAGIHGTLANSRTFRHSFNDRGKRQGVPDHVRRALLGHRTQAANDHYGALIGDELREYAAGTWGNTK